MYFGNFVFALILVIASEGAARAQSAGGGKGNNVRVAQAKVSSSVGLYGCDVIETERRSKRVVSQSIHRVELNEQQREVRFARDGSKYFYLRLDESGQVEAGSGSVVDGSFHDDVGISGILLDQ